MYYIQIRKNSLPLPLRLVTRRRSQFQSQQSTAKHTTKSNIHKYTTNGHNKARSHYCLMTWQQLVMMATLAKRTTSRRSFLPMSAPSGQLVTRQQASARPAADTSFCTWCGICSTSAVQWPGGCR